MEGLVTTISLRRFEVDADSGVIFDVVVKNESGRDLDLPLRRFVDNLELVSLTVRDSSGLRLDPVEYKRINPVEAPGLELLEDGGRRTFELAGRLEEKVPGVFALILPRATYRLVKNEQYLVGVDWGDFKAVPVSMSVP